MRTGFVETVRGRVQAADLGRTLVHEHLLIDLSCYWDPDTAPDLAGASLTPDLMADLRSAPFASFENLSLRRLDRAAAGLRRFQAAGGGAVVEVTSVGIGRQPLALRWLSEETGVHLVAGCGYYIATSHPPGLADRSVESLTSEIVGELTEGIADTGVRAGVIGEIGVGSWPPHPVEHTVLRASAAAQQLTGRAVIIHSPPDPATIEAYALELLRLGFDPARTVLSHLDVRLRADIDRFAGLAEQGFMLGLDTFGRDAFYPQWGRQQPADDVRVDAVVGLLERGLADHVFLAQDICFSHELTEHGGVGYHHVLARIVPRLLARGVTQEQCDQLLIDNLARLLAD
ncbi:phosphotriesterase family protein [Pseudactinotalea sp.]|uniref:phosphotriesterase family protein n=1 Tax=Pseudactinotalea sp. TaxID=1926260 RepID=UPI003B3BCF49